MKIFARILIFLLSFGLFNVCQSKDEYFDEFEIEGLKAHNEYRAMHGTPPLVLSRHICNYAKKYAHELARTENFDHNPQKKYGENLYYYGYTVPNASMAIKSWYDEIKYYDYNHPVFSKETGHFTAVIWKNVKKLGIAMATNEGTRITYIVANYDPHPNVEGQFRENVLPKMNPSLETYLDDKIFEEESLIIHNKFRALHGSPPLELNDEISAHAKQWAYHLAKNDLFEHRPENIYGENLYAYWNSDLKSVPTAEQAVQSWYDEIELYDFENPAFSKSTGHFTALVWKNCEKLGVARVTNFKTGKTYVVAEYSPWPNVEDEFAENVLPPLKIFREDATNSGLSSSKNSYFITVVIMLVYCLFKNTYNIM